MFNSGEAAEDFLNGTKNLKGKMAPGNRGLSNLTKCRLIEEKQLVKSAKLRGMTIAQAVDQVLVNSQPELIRYVLSRRETPIDGARNVAAQALLLRAAEIAKVASASDIPDEEALLSIERAEQAAIDMSSADAEGILSPDVAAAMKFSLDELSNQLQKKGLNGSMNQFLNVKTSNSFDFSAETLLGVPSDPGNPIGSPSPGGSTESNVSYPDQKNNANYYDDGEQELVAAPAKSGGGFWDIIDKIAGSAGKIAGAVTTIGGAVGTASSDIKNTASDIGADSINKSLKQNLPYIIGGIVLVIAIIVLIVYATKRR